MSSGEGEDEEGEGTAAGEVGRGGGEDRRARPLVEEGAWWR